MKLFVTFFFLFVFLFFWSALQDMQDLSSSTRDEPMPLQWNLGVLTNKLPGKSPPYFLSIASNNQGFVSSFFPGILLENFQIQHKCFNKKIIGQFPVQGSAELERTELPNIGINQTTCQNENITQGFFLITECDNISNRLNWREH